MDAPFPHPSWPSYRFRAMGSEIAFWLEADGLTVWEAFRQAEAVFIEAEWALSRFDSFSELSLLNARPGEWVSVSPLLWDITRRALALAEETGGLFDPTLLSALESAGYTHLFEEMMASTIGPLLSQAPEIGRWPEIGLDPERRAVLLPPGTKLDFGGIGKGYTARQAAHLLGRFGPCLVDAGGDLSAGAAPTGLPGWPVALAAPWDGSGEEPDNLLTLWLADASIATSGIDYRRWQADGHLRHHLIDPRTGEPAQTDALTATVLAPDASQAEAWATASLVAGMVDGIAALETRNLAGALVGADGTVALTPSMSRLTTWRAPATVFKDTLSQGV